MGTARSKSFRIGPAWSVRFSHDTCWLVVGHEDRVVLWDVQRAQAVAETGVEAGVASVDVAPNTRLISASSMQGEVTVLALPSLRTVVRLNEAPALPGSTGARFGPDSATLIDGTWPGELRVRDLETGLMRWSESGGSVMQLAMSGDRGTWAYDRGGQPAGVFARRWPFEEHPPVELPGSPAALALAVNRDGSKIAVYAGVLAVYTSDGACGWTEQARTDRLPEFMPPVTLAWTDDDLVLLTLDSGLYAFDADLTPIGKRPVPEVCDIDFVGTMLALGDYENGIVAPWQTVHARLLRRP